LEHPFRVILGTDGVRKIGHAKGKDNMSRTRPTITTIGFEHVLRLAEPFSVHGYPRIELHNKRDGFTSDEQALGIASE